MLVGVYYRRAREREEVHDQAQEGRIENGFRSLHPPGGDYHPRMQVPAAGGGGKYSEYQAEAGHYGYAGAEYRPQPLDVALPEADRNEARDGRGYGVHHEHEHRDYASYGRIHAIIGNAERAQYDAVGKEPHHHHHEHTHIQEEGVLHYPPAVAGYFSNWLHLTAFGTNILNFGCF